MQAKIYVLEADAGGLAPGLPATVVVEAHPGREFPAKIKKVDTLAKRRTGWIPVQYFGTTLELDATDATVMKPGQRVRAVLSLDRQPNAISVPRNAVFDKGGKRVVYKREGSRFRAVQVELGPAAVGRVVVVGGLEAGDVIALRDPEQVDQPGQSPGGGAGAPPLTGGGG